MSKFYLSADIGQSIDPTAIAVLEATTRRDAVNAYYMTPEDARAGMIVPPLDWYYTGLGASGKLKHPNHVVRIDVRHLERLPLRTNYVDVIAHVTRMLKRPPLNYPRAELVCDSTGCGRPVLDMFTRAGLKPIGVTITAGNKETRKGTDWNVAKILLVSRMQAMLHSGELRIAKDLPEARTLALEMQDFRANISETGIARFGAREGAHDDLVLAVAIGAWRASWNNYVTAGLFVA